MVLDRKIWDKKMLEKGIFGKQDCPFCMDYEYLLKSFKFWSLFKNKYPYNGLENNLLLVPNRHIEHTKELNKDELLELPEIEKFIEKYYTGEDYFSFIKHTNGGKSIKHIHYHYLPGNLYSNELEKIMEKQHQKIKEKLKKSFVRIKI